MDCDRDAEELLCDESNFAEAIVYGVRVRGTKDIRYVGSTARKLSVRLSVHLSQLPNTPFRAWAQSIINSGESLEMVVLCRLHAHPGETLRAAATAAEFRFIDALARNAHYNESPGLLNVINNPYPPNGAIRISLKSPRRSK